MKNGYRVAFLISVLICVALAAVSGWLWTRLKQSPTEGSVSAMPIQPQQTPAADTSPQPATQTEIPVAPVHLTPQRMQAIGVKIGTLQLKTSADEIRGYGNVLVNERKTAYVQTRFTGWIRKVFADATGEFIRQGQPLFTIYSPDVIATEQDYLLAKSNAAKLQQSSISGVAQGAASLLDAAKARLFQWDISPEEIRRLDESGRLANELTINSPVSGYITERTALPNAYVQLETKLYTVADLSQIWVYAQVFQSDSGKIKPGDAAGIIVDGFPAKVFRGRVDYLLPQADMSTRTIPVRIVFDNPDLQLKPGMYVNVSIKLPTQMQLFAPASAVFRSGTRNLIFVYSGDGNIEPREVEIGSQSGDEIPILKGAKAGAQIVTSANFLIDSEAQLQAAAGAFAPPPPAAGGAAAMNAPQANIDITTDPSPPRKGNNTVRVRLTSQDGKAISGAEITITFFMPAMPEMGMTAMKTVINAADKSGGMYEGKGELGAGGTWQVTIAARLNGQPIATKQMTMATGGM
jgi:RND family efflux transporter MFP subunit